MSKKFFFSFFYDYLAHFFISKKPNFPILFFTSNMIFEYTFIDMFALINWRELN